MYGSKPPVPWAFLRNARFLGGSVCMRPGQVPLAPFYTTRHFSEGSTALILFLKSNFRFPPIYLQKAPPHHPNARNEG